MAVKRIVQVLSLPTLALMLLTSCEASHRLANEILLSWPHNIPSWSSDGSGILVHLDSETFGDTFSFPFVKLGQVASDGSRIHWISEALPAAEHGYDFSPDISPDGTRIAFKTFRYTAGWFGLSTSEIATAALDGSNVRRLTKSVARESAPVWSPDGGSIAFISNGTLHTMGADGSNVRKLADSILATNDPPVWSPDGRYIAFIGFEQVAPHRSRLVLYTVARDSSETYRISETTQEKLSVKGAVASQPTWSPEGRQLAFARDGEGAGIYTSGPDGSSMRQVLPVAEAVHPAWSPDGSEIAFAADGIVSVVQTDGSGLRRLSPNIQGDILGMAWSPDGSRIAVSGEFWTAPRAWLLLTMDPDSGETRVLAEHVPESGVLAAGGRSLE